MQGRSATIPSVTSIHISTADIYPPKNTRIKHSGWRSTSHFLLATLIFILTPAAVSLAGQKQTGSTQTTAHSETLYFGVLPYLSSTALMKTWRPFADFIEQTLNKKVIIKTAPNFETFIQRTAEGRYDLLMTAPHFAAFAIKNSGYRIIAGHGNDLAGDIVVAKNSRFQSITDLRGKTLATPGPLAAVSMLAELTLIKHGLVPGKDITLKTMAAHNSALIAVAGGQAAAAVAVGGLYRRLNASKKFPQLRKLATTDNVPHAMYVASPSFSKRDVTLLQKALINPAPGSPGAKAVARMSRYFNGGELRIITQQKLDRLNAILSLLELKINHE